MNSQPDRQLDQVIANVEQLYAAVTGHGMPPLDGNYSPIPPETDAGQYLEEQLDRLVALATAGAEAPSEWTPLMSIRQAGEDLMIELDVAGVRRDAIHIVSTGRQLVVRGHRNSAASMRSSERPFGRFSRTILLPADARPNEMKAVLRDGVLAIRMPRAATDRTLDIPID